MEREGGDGEREVMEREEVNSVMNLVNFMLGRAVT